MHKVIIQRELWPPVFLLNAEAANVVRSDVVYLVKYRLQTLGFLDKDDILKSSLIIFTELIKYRPYSLHHIHFIAHNQIIDLKKPLHW